MRRRPPGRRDERAIRVLLLIWFPLIFRLPAHFPVSTTLPLGPYLWHRLAVTGALFLLSATALACGWERPGAGHGMDLCPARKPPVPPRMELLIKQYRRNLPIRPNRPTRPWGPLAHEQAGLASCLVLVLQYRPVCIPGAATQRPIDPSENLLLMACKTIVSP